jgi:hypothetical protein
LPRALSDTRLELAPLGLDSGARGYNPCCRDTASLPPSAPKGKQESAARGNSRCMAEPTRPLPGTRPELAPLGLDSGTRGDDDPFIVLTETKFSSRCIPVWIGTLLTGLGSKKKTHVIMFSPCPQRFPGDPLTPWVNSVEYLSSCLLTPLLLVFTSPSDQH